MREALLLGKQEGYRVAFHDVFFGNIIRDFHERIGYKVAKTLLWLAADLPEGNPLARIVLMGVPQADVVHSRYGFSQFTLVADSNIHPIGRLNTLWFRSTDPNLLCDRDALFALKRMEPTRALLMICQQESNLPSDLTFRQVLGSYRLEAEIDQVLPALA
jgi:hypothetical protein